MRILVTGAKGFIGRNLVLRLRSLGHTVYEEDITTPKEDFEEAIKVCDFVFHLAGVNRPLKEEEFRKGNCDTTATLINALTKEGNKAPVMLSSSIQAEQANPYGQSKKEGEDLLFAYSESEKVKVLIYRFPNVFGKWARPNYNSVVATFAYNIARGLPLTINDENAVLTLVYIDDLVAEMINALNGKETRIEPFCRVKVEYKRSVGEIARLLESFKDSRENLLIPRLDDDFTRKLYATYLSYLPENDFEYDLVMHTDNRGSFTELFKSNITGQVSVNVIKKGVTKGNHYHHTRNEKFLVVSGKAIIRFRHVSKSDIIEYEVSEAKHRVIDIPVGYVHNIENIGEGDLITLMWASEVYDPSNDDTYPEEV